MLSVYVQVCGFNVYKHTHTHTHTLGAWAFRCVFVCVCVFSSSAALTELSEGWQAADL